MRYILLFTTLFTLSFASFDGLFSFDADFTQTITDEKNKALVYEGHISAKKPQDVVWNYTKPITKDVFIGKFDVTIVEPEIEQVIVRELDSSFDFFTMIKDAKEITPTRYLATFKDSKLTIDIKNSLIDSISYIDEFENAVVILFTNQKHNVEIDKKRFKPSYPSHFDIILD